MRPVSGAIVSQSFEYSFNSLLTSISTILDELIMFISSMSPWGHVTSGPSKLMVMSATTTSPAVRRTISSSDRKAPKMTDWMYSRLARGISSR